MEEIITPFINLQTDFGFKELFGSEKNKPVLIRLLNALFKDKLVITDIGFHDKEILPSEEKGKRIVYDVYCTTTGPKGESIFYPSYQLKKGKDKADTTHHFILEMQNLYNPPFEERVVFYVCKMVSEQGKKGWDYELQPVLAVILTDFNFSHLSPKLTRDVMLLDRDTGEMLTDKLHIYLCSLKEVPQNWNECQTEIEEMMFLIKNMDTMDYNSLAYTEGRYQDVFEAARSSRLDKSEIIAYSESLEKLRDTQAGVQFAADKAREEGRLEGRLEGAMQKLKQLVSNLRSKGFDNTTIANLVDESEETVAAL